MVTIGNKELYLFNNEISFRLGIDGLTSIISSNFNEREMSNGIFIFFSKDRKQVKLIEYEKNNTWLYQSKLNGYKYISPVIENGIIRIDKRQLESIFNNLKLIKGKRLNN